ncbi:MAG: histidine phosphatase family protein [Acidimicrobiales bacterium]|nr:histidine phosphatase family protein [Acidimicrobiales bacterium]
MQLVVVRHAHAEPKKTWTGPDADRPLVSRGRRQAKSLAALVGRRRPVRLISSPATRCQQTVEPYARQTGSKVELSGSLARDAGPAALDLVKQLVADNASPVLLCTHREVIIELLPQLVRDAEMKLVHRLPGAKGGAWILHFRAGKLDKVDYRPPTA